MILVTFDEGGRVGGNLERSVTRRRLLRGWSGEGLGVGEGGNGR